MLILQIIAGWILLSCVATPFVGRFVFTHTAETDSEAEEDSRALSAAQ